MALVMYRTFSKHKTMKPVKPSRLNLCKIGLCFYFLSQVLEKACNGKTGDDDIIYDHRSNH